MNRKDFWQYDAAYWMEHLDSSENGLKDDVAQKILSTQVSIRRGQPVWLGDLKLLLSQFANPLMLMLIGAVILSAFIGEISDVFIILFIIITAGILGFVQERNAGRTVEKLQSMLTRKSTVLRDGEKLDVATESIVVGDILLFDAGDIIPADCVIVSDNDLHINEASLTGESFPVRKEKGVANINAPLNMRFNCLWEGTNVVSGSATAIAINVGDETLFGNIIRSATKRSETSFEKGIRDFGYFLLRITLILSIIILVVTLLNGKTIIDSALFALALAVGMAPELLPAITTIAMSAGARRLLEKKVIVKKLSSIQNLGEVNLLCTDKTGTITEGVITVADTLDISGGHSAFVANLAHLNAVLQAGYSNPIDDALKLIKPESDTYPEKNGEIPYDFIRKRLTVSVTITEDTSLLITKGSFDQITEICTKIRLPEGEIVPFDDIQKDKITAIYKQYGLKAYRIIGVCYKEVDGKALDKSVESDMIFTGIVLLNDPVKSDILDTLKSLKELCIDVKIITGDNRNVALAVAEKLNIHNPVIMTGETLRETSPEALIFNADKTHIFAEVEPYQKERIIAALRKNYTVAYMGDGINDVAALNAADIGISVDNAVDVAREAADIVLLEKDFSVIAEGIREGRKTFANTIKYIYISTGSTFGNMLSVAAASTLLPFLPMLPKQILLTNLISDFPYIMIASDNVDEEVLQKSGKWDIKIINRYMIIFGLHSTFFDILTFVVLFYMLSAAESTFQTGWFVVSVLTELVILFIIRTRRSFIKSLPEKKLFILSIVAILFTVALPYLPFADSIGLIALPIRTLGLMLGIVLLYIVTADLLKIWFFRKYKN